MNSFEYHAPSTLATALATLTATPNTRALAGGQSLLAAMRLGLAAPDALCDLQCLAGLQDIFVLNDVLSVGAMCTHDSIATSDAIHTFCPMLCALAQHIADQQVRNRGTLGGSIANNDPAACWPAALLVLDARVVTSQRDIAASVFFCGVYETALRVGELIVAVQFRKPTRAHYIKFEHAASRFALVGVAVSTYSEGKGQSVRVGLTGLGHGAVRWPEAEAALASAFSIDGFESLVLPIATATSDLHASAGYRVHLARVLTRRCVAALLNVKLASPLRAVTTQKEALFQEITSPNAHFCAAGIDANEARALPLHGTQTIPAPKTEVWSALFSPEHLTHCIPGAKQVELIAPQHFRTHAQVGLGMIVVNLTANIHANIEETGTQCVLNISYDAGRFGSGTGVARVRLTALSETMTHLDWRARAAPTGRLAQLGNRLIEASTQRLSAQFFARFESALCKAPAPQSVATRFAAFIQQLFKR